MSINCVLIKKLIEVLIPVYAPSIWELCQYVKTKQPITEIPYDTLVRRCHGNSNDSSILINTDTVASS